MTADDRPWWAVPIHPSAQQQHTDAAMRFVKTLLEIKSAINPYAHHHFRWVIGNAVHVRLLSTLALYRNDQIMRAGEQQPDLLVGLAIRVDEAVDGIYLEWLE
jgi:hypothetical protein